jgi:N-dimethylarginine dimethylaminohydrolase
MHLMGLLRLVDHDLAYVRDGGLPRSAIEALRHCGYETRIFPSEDEIRSGMAHNFVTLAPRNILMPAGNTTTQREFAKAGITVIAVDVGEITKAAGAIGCLTGVLARDPA